MKTNAANSAKPPARAIAIGASDKLRFQRQARELKKHLRDLTVCVTQCLAALDAEMLKPSTPERGSRIARISNALNLQNDIARRFGLGLTK